MGNDPCERCGARVRSQGDHTCPPCAEYLGRDVGDPWWGDFAAHPDSGLLPVKLARAFVIDMGRMVAAFAVDMARMPRAMAASARGQWDDFVWLERNRRGR